MLMRLNRRLRRVLTILVLGAGLSATPARGEEAEDKGPYYDVGVMEARRPWVQWVIAAAMVALCLGAALKNPHRSHLD
ncbi:hypothetical protein RAS1_26930 [Phycisphaerae bacterium RAS1]|nr:hypothetical protein RAS1_26930 [Phycisphaerae bacterium RAS1]